MPFCFAFVKSQAPLFFHEAYLEVPQNFSYCLGSCN